MASEAYRCRSCSSYACIQCSNFFFQAEDGIRDLYVTGVQTCALPIFIPSVGTAGQPAQHVFGAEDRQSETLECAVERRRDHEPARADHLGTTADEKGKISRSEEHTSELQSRRDLVCRLLLEKKKSC